MKLEIRQQVHRAAEHYGLSRNLVAAIVQVESGGDPWAHRVEPGYRWLWDVEAGKPYTLDKPTLIPKDFPSPPLASRQTEFWGQKSSWGLMQVMGAVAREQGFRSSYLTLLCDPREGLGAGCRHLVTLHRRFGADHGWVGVVAAYNWGHPSYEEDGSFLNQGYVDKVRELGGLPL